MQYKFIKSKLVPDSNGFLTEYTMYFNPETEEYFFMFGDSDLYEPDPDYADWTCETKELADEWFEDYNGFDDEEGWDRWEVESSKDDWDEDDSYFESVSPNSGRKQISKNIYVMNYRGTYIVLYKGHNEAEFKFEEDAFEYAKKLAKLKDDRLTEDIANEEDIRIIDTGLTGKINYEVLDSVIGQLADGIWENSPRMEPYWKLTDIELDGNKVIIKILRNRYDKYAGRWNARMARHEGKFFVSPFNNLSDDEVKKWFATKIKYIVKLEQEHNPDESLSWLRDNDTELDYMYSGVTVADAYRVYDKLMGRLNRSSDISKLTFKRGSELQKGDIIDDKEVDKVEYDDDTQYEMTIYFTDGTTKPTTKYQNERVTIKEDNLQEDLIQSDSEDAFKKNVETEIKAGKPREQALAIAYSVKRKNKKKKKNESLQDEDGWGELIREMTSDTLKDISSLLYEIEKTVRGAYTGAKTADELADYFDEYSFQMRQIADDLRNNADRLDENKCKRNKCLNKKRGK